MTREAWHQAEAERMRQEARRYKNMMIDGILDFQTKNQFTRDDLEKKSIRTLERIFDYID